MQKRTKVKNVLYNIVLVILMLLCIVSIYISYKKFNEINNVYNSYKSITKKVYKKDADNIDFKMLKKINPDIVAWIKIPDTKIDHPIVMARENNNYYLVHNVSGEYSQYGAIFTDCRLYGSALKSKNCIIYGHNMGRWTDIMFSSLMKYENQKYYNNHKKIYIYTEEKGRVEYRIVSVREVNDSSYAFKLTFETDKIYTDWLKKSISESIVKCDPPDISKIKSVVTLSTCTYTQNKLVLVCIASN